MSCVGFDLRTLGRGPMLLVASAAALSVVAVAYAHAAYSPATATTILAACLEEALPLACGLACAGVIAGDRTLELQATARPALARLALVRMGAVLGAVATAAAPVCGLAVAEGTSLPRGTLGGAAFTLLAPAAFLAALAFAVSLAVQSATAAAALLAGVWAAENAAYSLLSTGPLARLFLFATTYAPHVAWWPDNRAALLLVALALLAAGALALNRPGTALHLVHGDAS